MTTVNYKNLGHRQRAVVDYIKKHGPTPIHEVHNALYTGLAFTKWAHVPDSLVQRGIISWDTSDVLRLVESSNAS